MLVMLGAIAAFYCSPHRGLPCRSAEDAVREVTDFYRVFHSSRIVGDHLVFRLMRPLTDEAGAVTKAEGGSTGGQRLHLGQAQHQLQQSRRERSSRSARSTPSEALHY